LAGTGSVSEVTLPPFRDWFVGLLPPNPVAAAADGEILPLVLFTVVFALAATRIEPPLRETLTRGARAVSETILVVVRWILATAPIGVFALTLDLAAQTGISVIRAVAGFLLVVAILLTIAILSLYPLVGILARIPIGRFARACGPAQAVGFSTRSSMASLPVMLEEAEETLHLPDQVSGLVLPAAVSVFKYASPMTRIAGSYFIASLFGVQLGPLEWASLAGFMGLLSFYSPGIPSGGLFVMAPIYQAFGLPMEGIGILIALDLIPDMYLTVANVTGDMAVAALVREA
jgi:Na+/H+-dicarboxylate symporter